MPRNKTKARAANLPTAVKPLAETAVPGFWEARLIPWLDRHAVAVALCLTVFATMRIAATWPQTGLTYDEPQHFSAGLEWLAKHVYRYETQHPPLARAMTAMGPYLLDGARPTGN